LLVIFVKTSKTSYWRKDRRRKDIFGTRRWGRSKQLLDDLQGKWWQGIM